VRAYGGEYKTRFPHRVLSPLLTVDAKRKPESVAEGKDFIG